MRNRKTAEVLERFSKKRLAAEAAAEARCLEVYAAVPEIKEIDKKLRTTAVNILAIASSGVDVDEKMAALRAETDAIRSERERLLEAAGYPAGYTDIKYECPVCGDTGYVGTKVCDCLRREVAAAALEDSGLGSLAKTQSFDNFDLSYYSGEARETVAHAFRTLKDFAENFDGGEQKSFLLVGASGLGKTHLSTAVAKTVIDRGYRVVYNTIDRIIDDFQAERFRDLMTYDELADTYFDCDLLVVDDLGCEMQNQFSVNCVYNIINTRLNSGKATIINSNLTSEELRRFYYDRITSRLFGEFHVLVFKGEDIRRKKLQNR